VLEVAQLGGVELLARPVAQQVGREQGVEAGLCERKQRLVMPECVVGIEGDQVKHGAGAPSDQGQPCCPTRPIVHQCLTWLHNAGRQLRRWQASEGWRTRARGSCQAMRVRLPPEAGRVRVARNG